MHKNLYNKKREHKQPTTVAAFSSFVFERDWIRSFRFEKGLDSLTSFAHPGAPFGEHKQPTTIQIAFMAIYDDP
jgi:hypothetical protein